MNFREHQVILESIPKTLKKFWNPLPLNLLFPDNCIHLLSLAGKLRNGNCRKNGKARKKNRLLISYSTFHLRKDHWNSDVPELTGVSSLNCCRCFRSFFSAVLFSHVSQVNLAKGIPKIPVGVHQVHAVTCEVYHALLGFLSWNVGCHKEDS
ncbi:hypothetical protein D3C72_1491980 [compost metagenome]